MPASGNRSNVARRSVFRLRGKSARSVDCEARRSPPGDCGDLLHIGPALGPGGRRGLGPRAHSTLGPASRVTDKQERAAHAERCDRVSLDRRGLTTLPDSLCSLEVGCGPRLLSLQHNLLTSLQGLSTPCLTSLVLLDLYDNQVQEIAALDTLKSLRVLLMGKNRIKKIEGLSGVAAKLEVLDLHGNRITLAGGLSGLRELKVLNLAGNQLRSADLRGLPQLRELNLKRNKLRRVSGCDGVPKLQKLFLSNNDLQSVEDISSVAMATSLREVTLDGNPVALGGDCVPFLVSYLPTLAFISQMQVTDQVRRAAMAWRQNKEASTNIAFQDLGEEADANARREQVISNARTNWELLRSQSKCISSPTASIGGNTTNLSGEFPLEPCGLPKSETPDLIKTTNFINFSKPTTINQNFKFNNVANPNLTKNAINSSNHVGFGEKRVNFSHRSVSQDTDVSHSTSTSSELLKLPPILVPIIDSLEHQRLTLGGLDVSDKPAKNLKRWESLSSVEPVMNSSLSSLPTTTSESESETKKAPQRRVQTANKKRATFAASKSVSISDNYTYGKLPMKNRSISDNSENMSVLSTATNLNSTLTNSSTSGSEMASRLGRREVLSGAGSAKSRYIKSATTSRRTVQKQTLNRPVTAKPKPVSKTVLESAQVNQESVAKDREQGGDWLVEVRSNEGSIWGLGALKRLEKGWAPAEGVTTLHFHYVNFADITAKLPIIKSRFPNAVHLTFRACGVSMAGQLGALAALRGVTSLAINREGNPLATRPWHKYALYRLAHWGLRTVDLKEVTDEEIAAANLEYAGLSDVVLWSLPDSLLQPLLSRLQGEKDGNTKQALDRDGNNTMDIHRQNRDSSVQRRILDRDNSIQRRNWDKDTQRRVDTRDGSNSRRMCEKVEEDVVPVGAARSWLWSADPALRDVVAREALQWRRSVMSQEEVVLRHRGRAHLSRVLCQAAHAAIKLRLLRRQWPAIILLLFTQILQDYSRMPDHVAKHMRELNAQLVIQGAAKK